MRTKNVRSMVQSSAAGNPGAPTPPAPETALAAPVGYQPRPLGGVHERSVSVPQKRAVFAAATEVRDSSDYLELFGRTAPEQVAFATAIGNAAGWSSVIMQVENWTRWAKEQEKDAWRHAFVSLDAMKPVIGGAASASGDVAKEFPSLLRYYSLDALRGSKAAAARKATKAAKAAAEKTAAAQNETPAPSTGEQPAKVVVVHGDVAPSKEVATTTKG